MVSFIVLDFCKNRFLWLSSQAFGTKLYNSDHIGNHKVMLINKCNNMLLIGFMLEYFKMMHIMLSLIQVSLISKFWAMWEIWQIVAWMLLCIDVDVLKVYSKTDCFDWISWFFAVFQVLHVTISGATVTYSRNAEQLTKTGRWLGWRIFSSTNRRSMKSEIGLRCVYKSCLRFYILRMNW